MLCSAVNNYIDSVKGLPFFYVVGDNDYCTALEDLKQNSFDVLRVSDFCTKNDKFPDIDSIIDHIRTSDIDYKGNRVVIIGLGEYLALKGESEVKSILNRLNNTTLGNARVIVLLRGVTPYVVEMLKLDQRIETSGRAYISENSISSIFIINTKKDMNSDNKNGIKFLLRKLEDGECGNINGNTELSLMDSLFTVINITDSYSAISYIIKNLDLSREYGTSEQWKKLYYDIIMHDKKIENVFEEYDLEDIEQDFYNKISGFEYRNWLIFIFLKINAGKIRNSYLKYVVDNTMMFDCFKNNILKHIVNISRTDKSYKQLYYDRKKLIKDFPESDIAVFANENSINPKESLYRFTDNTILERKLIVKWIANNGLNESIKEIYPALGMYLKKYIFDCGQMSDVLTSYFDEYKKQKVENKLNNDFLELVDKYSLNPIYTHLPTRDNAIKNIKDKESSFLCWVDALGVEYLSYITELVNKKGLSATIEITRVDLPTITSFNNQFFEQWAWDKYKENRLDEIKHKEKGGFIFTDENPEPLHLASELKIIEEVISWATTKLAMHECKSFVIASDHGASRLAVIRKQEEKYDTDTKGKHSGRCCREFEGCDLPYAISENGFLVLTNYGRFKGSRAANVEVHGGASLEEVVVPVITLKLKSDLRVKIEIIDEDNIRPDRHLGTIVKLYISDVTSTDNVSIVINGTSYIATCEDKNHYMFVLNDIRRSKEYQADIYDGDNLIGNKIIKVKGKIASSDTGFGDDLF